MISGGLRVTLPISLIGPFILTKLASEGVFSSLAAELGRYFFNSLEHCTTHIPLIGSTPLSIKASHSTDQTLWGLRSSNGIYQCVSR
jgi:hypothetical protein